MIELSSMKVLIVDDMDNMAKSIRGMLKVLEYGNKFYFGNNGREGWNVLQNHEIDLAIIDWNMPVMTGIELLEAIREDKNIRDVPIIMVTAEANKEIVAEAAESDIDAYLLKPLTVKSLGDKIENVIHQVNNPSKTITHLRKGRELAELGRFDEAIEEAKNAILLDYTTSKPVRILGAFYYQKGDLDNAKKYFLKAARMNKLDVFAFHHLGEIYLQENDIDNAIKFYDQAMKISPRHINRGINFGKVLLEKDRADKAIRVFEKAFSKSPDPVQLKDDIADLVYDKKIFRYAIKLYSELLLRDSDNFNYLFRNGISHKQINDPKNAIKYFMECEKLQPENVDVKLNMALSYMTIGQVYKADRLLNIILKLDPENKQAKKLLIQNL